MPPRNVGIVLATVCVSIVCYAKTTHNRYAAMVAEGMELIQRHALQEVPARKLFENAMTGLVRGLDRYSAYIPPSDFQPFQESLDQQFGGIGIVLDSDAQSKYLTVLSPVVGTPAYRAGLRAADLILKIDGVSTEGMQLDEASSRLRGKPGTKVQLVIQHLGESETHEVIVERAVITVPSVLGDVRDASGQWRFVLEHEPRIGYVRVVSFGEKTVQELKTALTKLPADAEALIVDLRNDTGGLLSAAVETCDMFLDSGVIVTTRGRHGEIRNRYEATPTVVVPPNLPVVVLVNRYSASASEIVAACLQDHGRAVVAGERSWGKGTVQNIYPLEWGRSALKLTVATYWRPSGKDIHRREGAGEDEQWGVRPDPGLEVQLTDEQFRELSRIRSRRDVLGPVVPIDGPTAQAESTSSGTDEGSKGLWYDPQLQRAVEWIKKRGATE